MTNWEASMQALVRSINEANAALRTFVETWSKQFENARKARNGEP